MNQPMIELPKYKSYKIVRALSIAAIEVHEDKSATIAPSLTAYAPFKTQPGWAERFKGSEEDKGYYVVYDDGYASWSPTEAFENGYTRLREDHTPISELTAALKADDDYAWSWQCNLACIGIDSVSDMANAETTITPHETANRRAAQFMNNAFSLDIRTNERWKEFESLWAKETVLSVGELTFAGKCDTLLTQLQAVIDSPRKRTHEQMKAIAERLYQMGVTVSKMELT